MQFFSNSISDYQLTNATQSAATTTSTTTTFFTNNQPQAINGNPNFSAYLSEDLLNTISVIDILVLIMGTVGNLSSFYLLTNKNLKPLSSMVYLAYLCLVDTICLYGWYLSSIYRQLNSKGAKRLENINAFMCKSIAFISFTSLQISSILLCCLTLDRLLILISVKWRTNYARPSFAKKIVLIVFMLITALNAIVPIRLGNKGTVIYNNYDVQQIMGISTSQISMETLMDKDGKLANQLNIKMHLCYDQGDSFLKNWNILHLCVYSLIPFPILFVLNLIVIQMTRNTIKNKRVPTKLKMGQQFVTRLLLFLTLSFIICTLPSTIVYAFWRNRVLKLKYGRVLLNFLNTLQFSRHSSNWIIYAYSSSQLRESFKECISCVDSEYEITDYIVAQRPTIAANLIEELKKHNIDPQYYYYQYIQELNNQLNNNADHQNVRKVMRGANGADGSKENEEMLMSEEHKKLMVKEINRELDDTVQ